MDWLTEKEECVLINAEENSPLFSILADWSKSTDEDIWPQYIPEFREIILRWALEGHVEVWVGPDWPASYNGHRVDTADVPDLLNDPTSWEYTENPTKVINLVTTEKMRELKQPPVREP